MSEQQPDPRWSDRQWVLSQVARSGFAFELADERLRSDAGFVLEVLSCSDAWVLKYAGEQLLMSKEFILAAIRQDIAIRTSAIPLFHYAAKELKDDKELVMQVVAMHGQSMMCASYELRGDKEIVVHAVAAEQGHALKYATEAVRKDRDFLIQLLHRDGLLLQYAAEALKNDRMMLICSLRSPRGAMAVLNDRWLRSQRHLLAADRGFVGDAIAACPAEAAMLLEFGGIQPTSAVVLQITFGSGSPDEASPCTYTVIADTRMSALQVKEQALARLAIHGHNELPTTRELAVMIGSERVCDASPVERWPGVSLASAGLVNQVTVSLVPSDVRRVVELAISEAPEKAAELLTQEALDVEGTVVFRITFGCAGSSTCYLIVPLGCSAQEVKKQALKRLALPREVPSRDVTVLIGTEKIGDDIRVELWPGVQTGGHINAVELVMVRNLANASSEDRSNEALVTEFVQADGLELQWADPQLQDTEAVVQAAVQQNSRAFDYASARLKGEEGFAARMLEVVQGSRKGKDSAVAVARAIVRQTPFALLWECMQPFRDNEDVVKQAILQNHESFEHASQRLRNDPQFLAQLMGEKAIAEDGDVRTWMADYVEDLVVRLLLIEGLVHQLDDADGVLGAIRLGIPDVFRYATDRVKKELMRQPATDNEDLERAFQTAVLR